MVFQENDPPPFQKHDLPLAENIGKAEAMKQVLFERGLYIPGMSENGPADGSNTRLSMKHVLSECLDFKTQKSQLQILFESCNHICDFFPKYHPELSTLERVWGIAK